MNVPYALSTAARLVAETTGVPYQKARAAVAAGNLAPLVDDPYRANEITELAAAPLVTAAVFTTMRQARRSLAASAIATAVRAAFPDAVAVLIRVDEEAPVCAHLGRVDLPGQVELDPWEHPELARLADAMFPWANVFANAADIPPGDGELIMVADAVLDLAAR